MTDKQDRSALILDQHLAGLLQKAIEIVLRDTFQIPLSLEAWSVSRAAVTLESYVSCQVRIREGQDKQYGNFILAFSRDTLAQVLRKSGIDDVDNPVYLDDAATELANQIYGMIKTNLNKIGYHLQMEIPSPVHEKDGMAMYVDSEKMIQPFVADGHNGRAVVTQDS